MLSNRRRHRLILRRNHRKHLAVWPKHLNRAIVRSRGNPFVAVAARVVGVFTPTCNTRHARKTDAEEAAQGASEPRIWSVSQFLDREIERLTSAC